MIWLGIETSCDETSIALVRDGREILVNLISSQIDLHQRYGGVVPELASRKHLEVFNPLMEDAFSQAGIAYSDIDGIGVSNGPGLVGSLLIGVAAAKTVAGFLDRPLLGINHLEGHIFANFLVHDAITFPSLCLLVSGGHTALIMLHSRERLELLGETRDDAAGECFDKGGRILGLPYPAGPVIDSEAQKSGNPAAIKFPRAHLQDTPYEFSFSGLKTSILYFVRTGGIDSHSMPDICASFQQAIVDVLVEKTMRAMKERNVRSLLLAGGVACNSALRRSLKQKASEESFSLYYPPPLLCTDNAAMIACKAYHEYRSGRRGSLELDVHPNLSIL